QRTKNLDGRDGLAYSPATRAWEEQFNIGANVRISSWTMKDVILLPVAHGGFGKPESPEILVYRRRPGCLWDIGCNSRREGIGRKCAESWESFAVELEIG